jgi:MinD superfamily P-loop ATPase
MAYEILIASGKGGAGKTTVSASLTKFLGDRVLVADYDVDAANLSILTSKNVVNKYDFQAGYTAKIDRSACINCGKCKSVCKFDAIIKNENFYTIDEYSCEGCGFCSDVCLTQCITIRKKTVGEWYEEKTLFNSTLYSARLDPGSDNSGKLVSFLKEKAHQKAEEQEIEYIVSDAPPGIGCPTIASMSGIDALIVVVEMGITGIKDAIRLINLAKKFRIKTYCVFNKVGMTNKINDTEHEIKSLLKKEGIEILGYIPYYKEFITLLQQKKLPTDSRNKDIINNFEEIFNKILNIGEINK